MSDDQRKQLRKAGQVEIEAKDTDAGSNNNNTMKIYKLSLLLNSKKRLYRLDNWGLVAKDRKLVKGAEIGMHWSDGKLHFSVLSNN